MASANLPSRSTVLKRARIAAGLTQEELAARSGVSVHTISDLERGLARHTRTATLALLAEVLTLSPADRAALTTMRQPIPPSRWHLQSRDLRLEPGAVHPPLVGRTREVGRLEEHLAGEGPPLLLLAGEPGIGKSRLLQEAMARTDVQAWTVLTGGCHRKSGQEPYTPLLDALAGYLQRQPPAQARHALAGCAWLVRLLPELAEQGLLPIAPWKLPPEQERRLMFTAVERLLTNIAGPTGILLVLDDLQWAGADALELLSTLVRGAARIPLRVLGSYRTTEVRPGEPLATLVADLAVAGLAAQLELPPLAPQEAALLLSSLLDIGTGANSAQAEQIVQRTGGVPFFLVSCAQALRQTIQNGATSREEVPWTVAQSIRQRIVTLSPLAQVTLDTAALIGRKIQRSWLTTVAQRQGRVHRELQEALDTLCHACVLTEDGEEAYQFAHDLIRETVAGTMSTVRRAVLHLEIAIALEALPGEVPIEQLAYHYARSDDKEKAIVYLEQAANRAAARYAHAEAESLYREILDLAGERSDQRAVGAALEKLGTTLLNVARYAEALEVLEEAEQSYRVADDLEGRARALAQIGYVHTRQGTAALGIARVQPQMQAFAAEGLSAKGLATLDFTLGTLFNNSSRFADELVTSTRVVDHACSLGDDEMVAQGQMQRGMALRELGRLDEALVELGASASVAEATGDLHTLTRAYMNSMVVHRVRGEFEEARVCGKLALKYALQCGDPPLTALVCYHCGEVAYLAGDWGRAQKYHQQAADAIREVYLTYAASFPLLGLGLLRLAEGKDEEAFLLLQESIVLAESSGVLPTLRPAQAALAEHDLLEGRAESAYERLTPLLDCHSGQVEADVIPLLTLLAWAHLELNRADLAARIVAESLARASTMQHRLALLDALRVQALLSLRRHRWKKAESALEAALARSQALPCPYAEAKVLYVYGLFYTARGKSQSARERLEAALVICARLGERLYAQRIERALATIFSA
jgi:tetratricopeptide (TPR) repeat protein/transcriptional regulator with XRE-family HTH domain